MPDNTAIDFKTEMRLSKIWQKHRNWEDAKADIKALINSEKQSLLERLKQNIRVSSTMDEPFVHVSAIEAELKTLRGGK